MPTFGKTNIGTLSGFYANNFVCVFRFQLLEEGDVTKLTIYGSANPSQKMTGCIYDDLAGDTNNLMGLTQEGDTPIADAWTDYPFIPPLHLLPGFYWLGWNVPDRSFLAYYDALPANKYYWKASVYPAFPDPYGLRTGSSTREQSVHATYTLPGGVRWPMHRTFTLVI